MLPVVEPGPELSHEQIERYSRHLLVPGIGMTGQRRLLNARVAVVGAGGLGCPALLYLAAAGVGQITVIDNDVVEVSNLQRQVLHRSADIGVPKVTSAARAVTELNPMVMVNARHTDVTAENVHHLLARHDLVLDGTDNFPTRYLVNDACASLGLPLVWAAVLRFDAQVATFVPPPWVPATEAVQLRDLFPTAPPPEVVPSCADAGVLGAMVGHIGSIMAAEAVKLITGAGDPLVGRVLLVDAASMRTREIPLRPSHHAVGGEVIADPTGEPATTAHPAAADTPITLAQMAPTEVVESLPGITVLDVREPPEHELGTITSATLVPLADVLNWSDLSALPDGPVVVTCKVGPRAERAARHLVDLGHGDVRLLTGGMVAWIEQVDPSLPRY
ncbi:MAG: molybdopterin-synthase adenylyltransferase MoeB [Ornithinimicrobium sp.]